MRGHSVTTPVMKFMMRKTGHAQHINEVADAVGISPNQSSTALARLAAKPRTGISRCPDIGRGWYLFRPPPEAVAAEVKAEPAPVPGELTKDSTLEYLGRSHDGTHLVRDLGTMTIWKLEEF